MKMVTTALVSALIGVGACQPPDVPTSNPSPKSGHSCDRGLDLSVDEARPWQEKWDRIEAARRSGGVGEGTEACTTAHEFLQSCPKWSDQMSTVYGEVCAAKRRAIVAVKEEPGKPGCPAAWMTTPAEGKVVRQKIEDTMRRELGLSGMKDPNDARRVVNELKFVDMHHLHCDDEESAKELDSVVEKWTQETEKAIDEEVKCRASSSCMARRRGGGSSPVGADPCGRCNRERATCLADAQAGRFPEGEICATTEGAKQCCNLTWIQCANGQCGRVTN